MNKLIPIIISAIAIALVVGIGFPSYYAQVVEVQELRDKALSIPKAERQLLNLGHSSPVLGSTNAQITIVEFGDYQCTYCKKFFSETVESILINYVETGKVKMLFKDFIVVDGAIGGNDSMNAANAAHCANDQGMFWQFHSTLYNNWAGEGTGWVSSEQLNKFANTLELDMNEFSNCVSDLKWKKLVNASHDDAIALGVTATPTFFVIDENRNVLKITGAQHYDCLLYTSPSPRD